MLRNPKLYRLLISLLVPIMVVLGSVQILATDQYFRFEYGKAGFPADPYGFDKPQRLLFASTTLHWVRAGQPLEALAAQRLGDGPLYNQRELKHMQDVQDIFLVVRWSWRFALGLFILAGLFLVYREETLQELARGFKTGGLFAAGLVAVVGFLALVAWQLWFVAFHQIFFAPGTWTFNTSDTLIRLFPERFWYDAALTISGLSLAGGLGIAWLGSIMQRGDPSPRKAIRARKLKLFR